LNTKRLKEELDAFNAENKKVKITMGTLVVTAWCVFLIIIATFTQLDFDHYILTIPPKDGVFWHLKHCSYIPQVPVIFFIAALIGKRFGIAAVTLYILLGLTAFPVFALGGGINYLFQYNFGYILAFIPAVFIVAFMLKDKFNYATIAKADILGVLIIHLIGIFYLILMAVIHQDTFSNVASWIIMQTGSKMLYDLIFGYFAILISKPIKQLLWISMG
jgi:biotin transporter BioY